MPALDLFEMEKVVILQEIALLNTIIIRYVI